MAEKQQPQQPDLVRETSAWANWMLDEKPTSLRTDLLIVAPLSAVIAVITGWALGKDVVVVGAVGFVLGMIYMWWRARKSYALLVASIQTKVEALQQELEAEREKAAAGEEHLLDVLGTYHDHVYNVVLSIMGSDMSFADLNDENMRTLCQAAAAYLSTNTKSECRVSVWVEPEDGKSVESDSLKDRALSVLPFIDRDQGPNFEVLLAPKHSDEEIEAFEEVAVGPSWLKQMNRNEAKKKTQGVWTYREDDLRAVKRPEDDLKAFKRFEFYSVRAVSLKHGRKTVYLVALSKSTEPFSDLEARYLQWLRHALEIDEALHRPQQRIPI